LQNCTIEFLSRMRSDRTLLAQQLSRDLDVFRAELSIVVVNLLQSFAEKRQQDEVQLMRDLAVYVEDLQADVQVYLSELAAVRERRAQQVWQELDISHNNRIADVEALFQTFADFRTELSAHVANLRKQVWGADVKLAVPAPKSVTKKLVVKAIPPKHSPKAFTPKAPAKVAPVSKVAAKTEPAIAPAPVPTAVGASNGVAVATPPKVTSQLASLELEICDHIRKMQGARLPEIETALGINRFQAVDALRALIKEGVVTQRDRVYLIQEE
jgi:hypothetical protein